MSHSIYSLSTAIILGTCAAGSCDPLFFEMTVLPCFFLAVHNSSIGLIVPWSDQTNNQSLHNTTGWPLRLVTFETLDQTFWWQFLKTTFNDNFWWQFLMTIFDANFDDNFDDYFWWQVLMTIFGWQFFLGLIFNLWLVIFETLITILTIENLVS